MRVKLKGDMSGTRDGVPWPCRGEEIDLPDDEGVALCAAGMAVPAGAVDAEKAVPPDSVETRGPAGDVGDDESSAPSRAAGRASKPKPKG